MTSRYLVGGLLGTYILVGGACPQPPAITTIESTPEVTTNTPTTTETVAQYVEYSSAALAEAQANGTVVLYFYANWCSTCRVLNEDLTNNVADLPANTTVLQVNFDTEEALKDRYDVLQQHTLIQLDANGNEVTRWIGGDVETMLDSLQ